MDIKQRNHTFDLLCGICIVRMVVLHTLQTSGYSTLSWWQQIMDWTFYFMCFFFFKAGYFNRSVKGPTLPYLKDRTKRLFVPYITNGLVGVVLFWIFLFLLDGVYSKNPVYFSWNHLWLWGDFYGNAPVWFLLSFYAMYVSVHFLEKWKPLRIAVLSFPFLGYVLYTHDNPLYFTLNNIFMGVFCFYLGRYWHIAITHTPRRWMLPLSLALIGLFVAGNIFFFGTYSMHTNHFAGNPWGAVFNTILILCGLSGLLLTIKLPRIPVINYIGQHSMVYFVLHFPLLYFFSNISRLFRHSMYHRTDAVILAILFILITCTWLVPYFEKTPILSGRWKKKNSSD